MASRTTAVLIEWRIGDEWHGIQEKYSRKHIKPEGALDIGQQVKVKYNGRWYDAITVESGKSKSTTKAKGASKKASQPVQPKPSQDESSDDESSEENVPLKTIQKELKTANAEQALYDKYIEQRNGKLSQETSTHHEKAPIKRKLHEESATLTASEHHQPTPVKKISKEQPKKKLAKLLDAVKNDSKDVHSENAAAGVPLDTKQPDRDLADNANRSLSTPLTFSDDEGHESYDFNDWWAEDTYNQSGVEQISEDVRTIRDWVEGLHRKSDMVYSLMTAMEARLGAIEAGICLVPLPSQPPFQQPYHVPSQSVPPATQSGTTTATPVFLGSTPSSSNFMVPPVQSTSMTPTQQPRPLSSGISPIVHNFPKEKADRLKTC